MAAKFRKVDPRIWTDERFRKLNPEERLLAVYCLTCPQANRIGFYHLSLGQASEATGYPTDTLKGGIKKICDTLRWRFDEASGVLFFPTWWKYNGACGPRTIAGYLEDLHDVPETVLFKEFASATRYLSEAETRVLKSKCDTHAIPIGGVCSIGAQEQEQEQEQEREEGATSSEAIKRHELTYQKLPPRFAEFWAAYPNQTKRVKAVEAWKQLDPSAAACESIMAGLARWKQSQQWADQKIELAANWLTDRLFEEEPTPAKPTAPPAPPELTPEQKLERNRRLYG